VWVEELGTELRFKYLVLQSPDTGYLPVRHLRPPAPPDVGDDASPEAAIQATHRL
jgi:hypothetical protein